MERVGEEKEIQALFYELKAADESFAPEFLMTWERAVSTRYRPRRALKTSFVLASVLLVTIVYPIVSWQSSKAPADGSIPVAVVSPPTLPLPNRVVANNKAEAVNTRPRRVLSRRRTPRSRVRAADIRMAVAVSKWQSPTAILMQSPAEEVWAALPPLDQSVTELKTFLPNAVK